jgi:hypothetical protein
VLLEEMGHGRAPNPSPNHGCQQAQEAGRDSTGEAVGYLYRFMTFQRGILQYEF